jgi:hypothetical protein
VDKSKISIKIHASAENAKYPNDTEKENIDKIVDL